MSAPSAKIIADSVWDGARVTTMEVVTHRFVLAEFNTHRAFSRNSASSRAIPFKKMLARAMEDPALPVSWPSEKSGMQGGEELSLPEQAMAISNWLTARDSAVDHASRLHALGVHKSVINRLLEPFLWHTVIVTSTEWENFFRQRCSPLAQPEIRAAAEAMRDAYDASTPQPLDIGRWHMPLIDLADYDRPIGDLATLLKMSAARCARVSYLTHDGRRDPQEDLALYQRLITASPAHWSPLEHVCTPTGWDPYLGRYGNFRGWLQLRHVVESGVNPPDGAELAGALR